MRRVISNSAVRRIGSQALCSLLAKRELSTVKSAMSAHRTIDDIYSQFSRMNGAFFSRGWGDLNLFLSKERARWDWTYEYVKPDSISESCSTSEAQTTASTSSYTANPDSSPPTKWPPATLNLDWKTILKDLNHTVLEAEFDTPVTGPVYDALPPESRYVGAPRRSMKARVQLLLPPGKELSDDLSCMLYLPGKW
eukprot:1192242-Prorocentrum_minimum.AAC.2